QGVLGVVGVKVGNAIQAAGPLRRPQRARSVTLLTARRGAIDSGPPPIPPGVRRAPRPPPGRGLPPGARPAPPDPPPPLDWARLHRQALTFARTAGGD